jgi:hypothetical protein
MRSMVRAAVFVAALSIAAAAAAPDRVTISIATGPICRVRVHHDHDAALRPRRVCPVPRVPAVPGCKALPQPVQLD